MEPRAVDMEDMETAKGASDGEGGSGHENDDSATGVGSSEEVVKSEVDKTGSSVSEQMGKIDKSEENVQNCDLNLSVDKKYDIDKRSSSSSISEEDDVKEKENQWETIESENNDVIKDISSYLVLSFDNECDSDRDQSSPSYTPAHDEERKHEIDNLLNVSKIEKYEVQEDVKEIEDINIEVGECSSQISSNTVQPITFIDTDEENPPLYENYLFFGESPKRFSCGLELEVVDYGLSNAGESSFSLQEQLTETINTSVMFDVGEDNSTPDGEGSAFTQLKVEHFKENPFHSQIFKDDKQFGKDIDEGSEENFYTEFIFSRSDELKEGVASTVGSDKSDTNNNTSDNVSEDGGIEIRINDIESDFCSGKHMTLDSTGESLNPGLVKNGSDKEIVATGVLESSGDLLSHIDIVEHKDNMESADIKHKGLDIDLSSDSTGECLNPGLEKNGSDKEIVASGVLESSGDLLGHIDIVEHKDNMESADIKHKGLDIDLSSDSTGECLNPGLEKNGSDKEIVATGVLESSGDLSSHIDIDEHKDNMEAVDIKHKGLDIEIIEPTENEGINAILLGDDDTTKCLVGDSLYSATSENDFQPSVSDNNSAGIISGNHLSLHDIPVIRKSIYLKKHEVEGRSRSPSPMPRRYRKISGQLQKAPLILTKRFDQTTDNANMEIAPVHSKVPAPAGLNESTAPSELLNADEPVVDVSKSLAQKNENADDNDECTATTGLLGTYKNIMQKGMRVGRMKRSSGGSTSEDEMPSVHKGEQVGREAKGRRNNQIKYEPLATKQRTLSYDEDEFGQDVHLKSEVNEDDFLENEDIFTNTAVLAAYAAKRRRSSGSLRNGRERRRTTSNGSDSICDEAPSRERTVSQSSAVLKLTERDLFNQEIIEKFIQPMKLPPKKQRTLSSGSEYLYPQDSSDVKSQRSRSHGTLEALAPVVIRRLSAAIEPWKGAWDNTFFKIVEPTDTLASVAAHFDITPSELAILNRLPSRTVFPGQVIRVPDKRRRDADSEDKENKQDNPEGAADAAHEDKSEVCDDEMDMLEKLRLTSPKPGHAERVRTPLSPTPDPSHQRFLKINVRHITDGQGVVSGVLLVTSNAVMFDPNVSDPLVIEHGPESYGVIAPMEYVVNVAIYHDIAHMRVGSHDQFRPDWPKPEVYYLKEVSLGGEETEGEGSSGTLLTTNQGDSLDSGDPHQSPSAREDSLLAKDETFPELRSSTEDEEEEDNGSMCSSSVPREGDAFPKAFDRELVTPTNLTTPSEKQETEHEDQTPKLEGVAMIRSLEERRKSSLDHHWAVPSKVRSLEEQSASVPDTQVMDNNRRNSEGLLVKQSCHDSGIDIRDPPPVVPHLPRKSVYSDADVLLGDDFVPPVPIQPLRPDDDFERRKKTSSVSFSLDDMKEGDEDVVPLREKDDTEKETKKNKMLKRLSYPLSWMEGLSGDKEEKEGSIPSSAESQHPSSHSSSSVFSKVFSSSPINMVTDFGSGLFMKTPSEEGGRFPFPPNPPDPPPTPASADSTKPQGLASFSPSNIITSVGRSSVGTFIRQQHHSSSSSKDKTIAPRLDYRSMVSVEDMPELFVSFDTGSNIKWNKRVDELSRNLAHELIPRPAQSCDDPPLYLRLRMGKPKDKKIPKSTPIMSYGKKKMRPEYWFSVPRERVDDLYRFLMVWVPQLYGDLNETTVADRGYELVDSDTELWETEDSGKQDGRRGSDDELGELTRESWEVLKAPYCKLYTILKTQAQMGSTESGDEVLSMSEELRRALYASSAASLDLELCIPDLNGVTEILSEDHRKQLCRHLPARAEGYVWTLVFSTSQHGFSLNSMYRKMTRVESPILMVIQDTENNVFGALTSCSLKMSDHFYGTGESLLFRFTPDIQVYNWTGDNMYFIKGNNESLSIGAGDGKFGLWLDGDLYQGRTEPCNTYGNDPLTPSQDFVVKTLECWAFI